jgi:hypothetical protein
VSPIKPKFVEPNDSPSLEAEAVDAFEKAGWSQEDAKWLGLLALSMCRTTPDGDGVARKHSH